MSSIFKPTYTRTDTKTGKKVTCKLSKWYGSYFDPQKGRWVRIALATNKEAAQAILGNLIKAAELAGAGIFDPFEKHRKRPLADHLDDFEQSMTNRGNTRAHVNLVIARSKAIIEGCGFALIGDISASKVETFVAELRTGKKKLSIQTSNFYLQAIKQFCRWLARDMRTDRNPVEFLQGGNVKLDVRRQRRELEEDEIARLLKAARAGGVTSKLTGEQRFYLYAAALGTGLRAAELASLTPASFDLKSDPPTVTIEAADEKARRGDSLPLPPDLAELLRLWLSAYAPDTLLWPGVWAAQKRAGKLMQVDLGAAKRAWIEEAKEDVAERNRREKSTFLEYRTPDGLSADFHALRHTFLSRLGRSGVSAKVMQRLARHSTVELTLGRYTHASLHDLAGAVKKLPKLPTESAPAAERPAVLDLGRGVARPAS